MTVRSVKSMEDQFVEERKKEKESADAYGIKRRNDQMVSENRKNEHRRNGRTSQGYWIELRARIAPLNS